MIASSLLALTLAVSNAPPEPVLYRSDSFTVRASSVEQGPFSARAVDRDTIVSSYPRAAQEAMFKFSINGADNEFAPGTDHMIYIRPREGRIVTPVYTFGVTDPPLIPEPSLSTSGEEGRAAVTFRLDMRHVLESFRTTGVYDPPNGPPIRAGDFQAVYIAGNVAPLGWDFSVFTPGSPFQLTDPDGDGVYSVTLPFEAKYNRPVDANGAAFWKRSRDLSSFPEYNSPQLLVDAIYRLSLEELLLLTREDGAILGGAKWPDVWTRDLAWGTILAFAPLAPDSVKTSLMLKVDAHGRIVQDTGTGGSWPVSTDRMAWAAAAWELYKVTGDDDWLRQSFEIIRRSAEADLHAAFDEKTGLFHGESSFLDWRDQSYPRWMDAADIYRSQTLGTNALHFAAWDILGKMARQLGEPAERYERMAERIRNGINTWLWQSDRGYYGQYRYGRNHRTLSPRAEGLGEALAIIFGVTGDEQRTRLARRNPVVEYGVPSFWPYIPDVPPYHNAGIWPQVIGFSVWSAAVAGNAAGVEHGLASVYRATALFLTNKENMVASTGHFEGTELNSDRLVGSVGAALGSVHRVLLGMRFHADRLTFEPFIPEAYAGTRTLRGLRYRQSIVDVTVRGFGDAVAEAKLDGKVVARAEIPATVTGRHDLKITMNGSIGPSAIHRVANLDSPATPSAQLTAPESAQSERLSWNAVDGAVSYVVYRNGERWRVTSGTTVDVPRRTNELTEYQVLAIGSEGQESFLSEPLRAVNGAGERVARPPHALLESRYEGHSGAGYVPLTTARNVSVPLRVKIEQAGLYAIDVRYANGSGPVNSSNRAAIRTLLVDGAPAGVLVMPQRGKDLWTDWGYSSVLQVHLTEGEHTLTIRYGENDRNMDGEINDALLDHVRLTLLRTHR